MTGAFPCKYKVLDAGPCRIVAFFDFGDMKVENSIG